MYRLRILSGGEDFSAELLPGPHEFGRGPVRDGVPRIALLDPTVSRDHVRLTPTAAGVFVENLSARVPIFLNDGEAGAVPAGIGVEVTVPCSLTFGGSRIQIELPAVPEPDVRATPTAPVHADPAAPHEPPVSAIPAAPVKLDIRSTLPPPKVLANPPAEAGVLAKWFAAITAVQTAPPGSPEFYQQTADAVVELIGMHSGLVLLGGGPNWRPVARAGRDGESDDGREYSLSLLRRACSSRETVFHANGGGAEDASASLVNVGAAVASPILGSDGTVLGVLYGSRPAWAGGRGLVAGGIGYLEAHALQLLAAAAGVGLERHAEQQRALALRAAKEAAEASEKAKGQFLALVSHELRTPLTAILGYTELLIEGAADDGADHMVADLTQIRTAGTHLLTVINDLLDLSKIEAGQFTVSAEPFAAAAVLTAAADTLKHLIAANGNKLVLDLDPDLGTVILDAARVRQCVINLLGNAAKFTKGGTITLSAQRAGGRLLIAVADTGIGIAPAKLAELFRPFAQADAETSKKYGGTGLGLALCRRLCQLMGGDVTAASEPGRGSTFTMELPAGD